MGELRPVNGFLFSTTEEVNAAKKEARAVVYLEERLKGRSPEEAKSMYTQIMDQGLFHTAVGYSFLKELQDSLKASGIEDLVPIRVDKSLEISGRPEVKPDAGSLSP